MEKTEEECLVRADQTGRMEMMGIIHLGRYLTVGHLRDGRRPEAHRLTGGVPEDRHRQTEVLLQIAVRHLAEGHRLKAEK